MRGSVMCVVTQWCFVSAGLIDYNFMCFKKAIQQVFDVRKQCAVGNSSSRIMPATHNFPHQNGRVDGTAS